jgi:hypothetical protein
MILHVILMPKNSILKGHRTKTLWLLKFKPPKGTYREYEGISAILKMYREKQI